MSTEAVARPELVEQAVPSARLDRPSRLSRPAWVDQTFYREAGRVRLQPENDALEPIYADHVQILGTVTGVFRKL